MAAHQDQEEKNIHEHEHEHRMKIQDILKMEEGKKNSGKLQEKRFPMFSVESFVPLWPPSDFAGVS
jgi:hypothetical protein